MAEQKAQVISIFSPKVIFLAGYKLEKTANYNLQWS